MVSIVRAVAIASVLGSSVTPALDARDAVATRMQARDGGDEVGQRVPVRALATTLIERGDVWRYRDDGIAPARGWDSPGFDDSSWRVGRAELGYGDGDEATVIGYGPDAKAKHPTTWFRHAFEVADPRVFARLRLRYLRDDGAVVWLNGVEIARSGMPWGAPGPDTWAASTASGSEEADWHTVDIPPSALRAGTNVVAVEVHQVRGTSSDLSFDLELVGSAADAMVVRGPYLQQGGPTSAVLRWRTDVPTGTVVWTGDGPSSLAMAFRADASTREHEALLTGLEPATSYAYAVGDAAGALAGGVADFAFRTAPVPGTDVPVRIWILGDSGTADARPASVRNAYLRWPGADHTDVWLMLGDNAYYDGSDAQYQAAVFDMYPAVLRSTFLWPTLGNHDARSASSGAQSGVYYDTFTLPKNGECGGVPSGTEAYYSFDHGDVHFVCLDSQDVDRSPTGPMLTWLRADLATNRRRWVIAYWHHPPYSKGSHDADKLEGSGGRLRDMRENALPILEQGGVDLVFSGHSHDYERSYLLDGLYGTSDALNPAMFVDRGDGRASGDGVYRKRDGGAPHDGAVYVVAGCGGQTSGGPLDDPAMVVSWNVLGSVVLDVRGDRLDATYLDWSGAVRDSFSLVKSASPVLRRDVPRISLATGGAQRLSIDCGAAHAGEGYVVAGSFATSPGFDLGALHVPLVQDAWFAVTLARVEQRDAAGHGGHARRRRPGHRDDLAAGAARSGAGRPHTAPRGGDVRRRRFPARDDAGVTDPRPLKHSQPHPV